MLAEFFARMDDQAFIAVSASRVVTAWSARAAEVTGFSESEAVGRLLDDVLPAPAGGAGDRPLDPGHLPSGWRLRKGGHRYWAALSSASIGATEADFGILVRDDTRRITVEEFLQHAKDPFRGLVESVEDYAILLLDPAGRVVSWNKGAQQITGYSPGEMIGQHVSCLCTPEDIARGEPAWALNVASAERRHATEGWSLRKDGSRYWADTVLTARREAGALIGFAQITRDMTERRLREERFRVAVESAPNAVVMMDPEGRIVMVNRQTERLFGYDREALLGRSIEVLVPERFRARHPWYRKEFMARPEARPMGAGRDLFGLRKDGTEVPVEIGLNPLTTAEGSFVLAAIVDITERKRAEERFRLAVESAPNPMVMVSGGGRIVMVNAQTERLFGYTRDELIGEVVEILVPDRFRGHHPDLRDGFFRAPRSRPMGAGRDLYGVRKDGTEVPVEIGLNPLHTGEGDFVLAAIVDITERKRGEQVVQAEKVTLEQRVAARTAELDATVQELERFTYTVAHDLRAPLRAVHRYTELIEAEVDAALPATARDYLLRIRGAAARMDRLTEDLLAYSRVSRAEQRPQMIDLRALAEEVLTALAAQVQESGADVTISDSQRRVWADRFLLSQALTNVVANALKFVRKGERPKVTIGSEATDQGVSVFVQDRGIGIDPRFKAKILQIFERLHPPETYPGTGIGLAIANKAVERMGGTITLESEPGKGARFDIELRAAPDE